LHFFLSRLLYFKFLTIEDLKQNSYGSTNVKAYGSTNVKAVSPPYFIKDFIRILNKLELFKKENKISLNLLSLFIKKLNSNRTLKETNNRNLTNQYYYNYTKQQSNLSNTLNTNKKKNRNSSMYD
jgi:hypothetical protein